MSWKFALRHEKKTNIVYLEKNDLESGFTTEIVKFYVEHVRTFETGTGFTNINLIFDNTNLTNIYNLVDKINKFLTMMLKMFIPMCCPIALNIDARTFEISEMYFKNQEINVSSFMSSQSLEGKSQWDVSNDDFSDFMSVCKNVLMKAPTETKESVRNSPETIIDSNPNIGILEKLKNIWAESSDEYDDEIEESLDDFMEKQIVEKSPVTVPVTVPVPVPISDDNRDDDSMTQSYCLDSCTNEYSQSKLLNIPTTNNFQMSPSALIQQFGNNQSLSFNDDVESSDTDTDTNTDTNTDPETNPITTSILDLSEIMGCIQLQNCSKTILEAIKIFVKTKFSYEYYEYLIEQFVGKNTDKNAGIFNNISVSENDGFSQIINVLKMMNICKQIKIDDDSRKYVEYKYNELDEKTHVFKYQHFVELCDSCMCLIDILIEGCE